MKFSSLFKTLESGHSFIPRLLYEYFRYKTKLNCKITIYRFHLGNNPARICELCSGFLEKKCSTDDPFAGYDGAFKCMSEDAGDVAFLRHDTVAQMAMNSSYMPDVSSSCIFSRTKTQEAINA